MGKRTIRIKNIEDFNKLVTIANDEKVEVLIDESMIKILLDSDIEDIHSPNINLILEIEDMSKLPIEELKLYQSKIKINSVRIKEDIYNSYNTYYDYSTEDYIEIREQVDHIISFTDETQSDLEKFLTIYKIIGESINYDYFIDENWNKIPSVWSDNQNLIRWTIRRNHSLCGLFKNITAGVEMCWN